MNTVEPIRSRKDLKKIEEILAKLNRFFYHDFTIVWNEHSATELSIMPAEK